MTQISLAHSINIEESNNLYSHAIVQEHNLQTLNKTRIRFKIGLKKASRRTAPKWVTVLESSPESPTSESDLEKVTNSEVGLKGISIFKALDDAAQALRQEIEVLTEWMNPDNGEWICSIELAPLVWNRMIYIRDLLAPELRANLRTEYEKGYLDFATRVEKFFSAQTWKLTPEKIAESKQEMLNAFPSTEELEGYLQVVIGRPTIIPALEQQLNEQQAECLAQINRFVQEYDLNLEQRLKEAAIAGGEQLAAELLDELANWEPGRKPVNFPKKVERHLKKIQVLLNNANTETSLTLNQMMNHVEEVLETASVDTKKMSFTGLSDLQQKMMTVRSKLLDEQQKLVELASIEGIGLSRATTMALKL